MVIFMEQRVLNLLEIIEKKEDATQRDLARYTGMSLGMVNILIKRWVILSLMMEIKIWITCFLIFIQFLKSNLNWWNGNNHIVYNISIVDIFLFFFIKSVEEEGVFL
ncbi:MAG: hypothetical protein PWR10_2359 [Halanaerobiales bacterium]|nr:hypothetical protein [Halanaerobiales bacterium]